MSTTKTPARPCRTCGKMPVYDREFRHHGMTEIYTASCGTKGCRPMWINTLLPWPSDGSNYHMMLDMLIGLWNSIQDGSLGEDGDDSDD